MIARHHGATGSDRVHPGSDLGRGHGDDEHRDDDRIEGRNQPSLAVLIRTSSELLLLREVRVRAVPTQHPVEKDLISIEDLQVHIGGRGVEHDRPRKRLKSWVCQSLARI